MEEVSQTLLHLSALDLTSKVGNDYKTRREGCVCVCDQSYFSGFYGFVASIIANGKLCG